ncbi:MAG: DUF3040 domain-containing protein [Streptosporangiaceae bacterium]
MSLSTREQQALDLIEDGLAGSDPALAALLATFTRLTSGEVMPAREKIGATGRDTRGARRLYQRLGLCRAALLLWLLIAIALIAFALAANRGGSGGACTKSLATVCAAPAPAHSPRPAAH